MLIKIQPRQTGKSYDIAKMMKEDKDIICVQPTEMQKTHFCHTFGIDKNRVVTFSNFINLKPRYSKVIIDEIGGCLNVYCRSNILYATHTN
jgi:hypothetical protein